METTIKKKPWQCRLDFHKDPLEGLGKWNGYGMDNYVTGPCGRCGEKVTIWHEDPTLGIILAGFPISLGALAIVVALALG